MILAQPLEVLLQVLPPGVDLSEGQSVQLFRFIQVLPDAAEGADREPGSPGGQIFQRDGQPFDFDGRLGHHILILLVFELGDGAGLARVLDGREVLPLDQLLEVKRQLLRGIVRKDVLSPKQEQYSVPIHLVVHLLVFQVEDAHNCSIGPVVIC